MSPHAICEQAANLWTASKSLLLLGTRETVPPGKDVHWGFEHAWYNLHPMACQCCTAPAAVQACSKGAAKTEPLDGKGLQHEAPQSLWCIAAYVP